MYSSDSGFDSDGSSSGHGHRTHQPSKRSTTWKCDPAFGVVHLERCTVCRHYMSHFVEGSRDPLDPSFQAAVGERDAKTTMRYVEGLEEGRRAQSEKDMARILKYRGQREEARAKNEEERSRRRAAEDEATMLRAEMMELKDAFMAMQIAYEEQISALTFGPGLGEREMEALRVMEVQDALLSESNGSKTCSGEAFPVAGPSGSVSVEDSTSPQKPDPNLCFDSTSPLEDQPFGIEDPPEAQPGGDQPTTLTKTAAQDLLNQLSHNPIRPEALLQLRSFCIQAHHTSVEKRSPVQKFVLQEAWRIPSIMGRNAMAYGVPLESVPEIFVDASVQGIGLWWDGRWAAWKLKKGWRANGREISWAEMVAVELGLRTLIAAGVRSTHIRVRSDNQRVVVGLSAQSVRNPQEGEILEKVLSLCRDSGLVAMPIWVWTKKNPADSLSRSQYPGWDSHVGTVVEIPSHLQEFVEAVKPRSA